MNDNRTAPICRTKKIKVMKTQIANLINGQKNVARQNENEKYLNAKQATSHIGFAGTNRNERAEIARKVYAENGETMNILFADVHLSLKKGQSVSGKTQWYSAPINEDLASQFVVKKGGNERTYTLTISNDCEVFISKNVRKNENCQWRLSYTQYIDESYIKIL